MSDEGILRLLARVRADYEEMPGLAVTVSQAASLWNVDLETADHVLAVLVDRGVLCAGPTGFVRVHRAVSKTTRSHLGAREPLASG